jgi:NAD-reducing hydrogenase small subunit
MKTSAAKKITLATTWLDGCSGCHMSFLDMDARLLDLVQHLDVVYSPLVDAKTLPKTVDIGLLEGSVSNTDDLHKVQLFRRHCRTLISLGDCAVTGNVPAMRNSFGLDSVFARAYQETATISAIQKPSVEVPSLLPIVKPVHAVVKVDVFVPGCPPSADAIYQILSLLIAGETPITSQITRFGA